MGVGLEDVVAVKALETGHRAARRRTSRSPTPSSACSTSRRAAPTRCSTRCGWRPGSARRSAMTAAALDAAPDGRHRSPDELGYALPDRRPGSLDGWLRRISGRRHELGLRSHNGAARRRGRAGGGDAHGAGHPSAGRAAAPASGRSPRCPLSEPAVPPTATTRPAEPAVDRPAAVAEPGACAGGLGRRQRTPVAERIVALVAEQTGYPADMLDMDLDLEADLGIDTVKQAELFATIREAYGIERDDTLKLRDYPTLEPRRRASCKSAPPPPAEVPGLRSSPRRPPVRAVDTVGPGRRRARRPGGLVAVSGRGGRADRGPGGRADRLPGRHAGLGPRPRSRPRHRHRQAGRAVRHHPRGLRHRARRHAQAARLPHLEPRRRASCTSSAGHASRPPSRPTTLRHRHDAAGGTTDSARPTPRLLTAECRCRVLRPPLELCAPTGVELGAGSRVVVMPDAGGVGDALAEPPARTGRRGAASSTARPSAEALEAQFDSLAGSPGRSPAFTGCPRSTTRARSDDARRRRRGRKACGSG